MIRRIATIAAVLLLAAGACTNGKKGPVPSPSGGTSSRCSFVGGTTVQLGTATGGHDFLVTDVRAEAQPCSDRITFELKPQTGTGGAPAYAALYQPGPFTDEAGRPVEVPGRAFLVVRMDPVHSIDATQSSSPRTYTGPDAIKGEGLAHVVQLKRTRDSGGEIVWVIGVDQQRPFAVATVTGDETLSLVIEVG